MKTKIWAVAVVFLLVAVAIFAVWDAPSGPARFKDPVQMKSTLAVTGATTLTGGVASDVAVANDTTGGNAGARNEISGRMLLAMVPFGTMTNASTETTLYLDDSPAGEWTPALVLDAGKMTIATTDVDTTAETITVTTHGLNNGTFVQYHAAAGTVLGGLADLGEYYLVGKTTSTFQLAATAGGAAINLTGTGNSSQYFLPRVHTAVSTSVYRVGANSLATSFTSLSAAGDGISRAITPDDLEADEFIGFWIYSTDVLVAGHLTLVLTDDGGARTYNVPAVATKNKWTWVEVDITALTGGTGDAVSAVAIKLSTAGTAAHSAFTVYLDQMYKWDAADELALSKDLAEDGVVGVLHQVKTDAAATAHTWTAAVQDTDFFVAYRSGNDSLVQITDQSTFTGFAVVSHR